MKREEKVFHTMFIFSQTTKVSYLIGENLKALRRLPGASVSFFQRESALCQKKKKKRAGQIQGSVALPPAACLLHSLQAIHGWGKKLLC